MTLEFLHRTCSSFKAAIVIANTNISSLEIIVNFFKNLYLDETFAEVFVHSFVDTLQNEFICIWLDPGRYGKTWGTAMWFIVSTML